MPEITAFFIVLFFIYCRIGIEMYLIAREEKNKFNPKEFKDLDPKYTPYVEKYFPLYHKLDKQTKQLFLSKTNWIILHKRFLPGGDLPHVTDEIKAVVAGTATMLSLGHPKMIFPKFKNIMVYPDKYFSRFGNNWHYGEVNPAGAIVVSVNRMMEGLEDTSDGINLLIHEFAHAFDLSNQMIKYQTRLISDHYMHTFHKLAKEEIKKGIAGNESIFREYAYSNFREFFAVSTELFFEKPGDLRAYKPALYDCMVGIFKLNPLGRDGRIVVMS